jgi:FkbM family methyltransferase
VSLRSVLVRARGVETLNHAATSVARAIGLARFESFVSHLPRTGEVDVQLPDGAMKLWSQADDWMTSRIWWRGYRAVEGESIDPWLEHARSARVVLDVGAYNAWYGLTAAVANPAARVLVFEPNPELLARCGYNAALNRVELTLLPYAVSDSARIVDFHLAGDHLPSASGIDGLAGVHRTIQVATTTIDDVVARWALPSVDLVKIDVEGHEPSVLRGMRRTITEHHPAVMFEVIAGTTGTDELVAAFGEGYRFRRLDPGGPTEVERPLPPVDRPFCNYFAEFGDRSE